MASLLCQAKGDVVGSCHQKGVLQPGGGFGEFYSGGSGAGLMIRIRVCAGLAFF